ncbi:hypothetical protein GCM10025857_26540 [Alicyclobacillus contaminans]|uniref:TIGR03826 family flagellar region protein n=1 Tax=Alicyclobacillus contaminans TaxID=392016 RepID=UPI0003FEAEAE|nr:TIGR03826 family flagellar region protein [Alicyclobacillus contaminans]GMA51297.1 hypothetical protein GCM10025857_26540 [Alicyclobacillus contaminans]
MTIAYCKRCGRIFNQVRRNICPACVAEEDKMFEIVKTYLRQNKDATMMQVTEETGVPTEFIVDMIRDGRLILRDNPNLTYPCERCGQPTQAGRYCAACTKELSESLSAASAQLKQKQHPQPGRGYYSKN